MPAAEGTGDLTGRKASDFCLYTLGPTLHVGHHLARSFLPMGSDSSRSLDCRRLMTCWLEKFPEYRQAKVKGLLVGAVAALAWE